MPTRQSIANVSSAVVLRSGGVPMGRNVFQMRHELVDAQVEVLRMFLEKRHRDELLEAVRRLADCAALSFREEEALMIATGSIPDPAHGERHREVLMQMDCLIRDVMVFDRGRLLARLILVDRCLTAHISDAVADLDAQGQERNAEHETATD